MNGRGAKSEMDASRCHGHISMKSFSLLSSYAWVIVFIDLCTDDIYGIDRTFILIAIIYFQFVLNVRPLSTFLFIIN